MYSNEDLERFYFKYQSEALPHGESIQSFCIKNNFPYNLFSKWYKDTRSKLVEVQVDGSPSPSPSPETLEAASLAQATESNSSTRILVELRMSNGLRLSQRNLNYRDLVRLVEKLEGLC